MNVRPRAPALLLTRYLLALMLAVAAGPAWCQPSASGGASLPANPAYASSAPAWNALSLSQQAALKPLAPIWSEIGTNRKRKWIALSANFSKLSPAEQTTLHGRMAEWATLSTVDRNRARLNFAETRTLSGEEKKAQWEAYQALSPDEKRKLAAQANSHPPIGAAPAVTNRTRGKLAAVPVTRSDASAGNAQAPRGATTAPPGHTAPARP